MPVQRPVHATGHQRLVVEPGDGGRQLARGRPDGLRQRVVVEIIGRDHGVRLARRHDPVAARHVDFAVEHDAGAVAGAHVARLARVIEHLRHHRVLAAGQQLYRHARRQAAGGHAAPEHAAALCFGALRGLKLGRGFFDPLHRKGKWQVRFARRHGQALQNF